jgi:hypothetical protein
LLNLIALLKKVQVMEDFKVEVEFQSEAIGKYEFVLRVKNLCFYQSKATVWYRINAAYVQNNQK